MIVCVCHRVSHRDIARAVRQGCASFEDLQDELRVAQGCGACNDCAREVFDEHHAQHPCALSMGDHWNSEGSVHVVALLDTDAPRGSAT